MNHYEIDDLSAGMTVELSKRITDEMMNNFRMISDDESSIHVNPEFAKGKGFKDRVVYGMLSSAFFSTIVGMYLPGENGLLQSMQCDYLRPVYINDNLHVRAEIEAVHRSVGQITIKAEIKNDDNDVVVTGKIKALVI